MDSTKTIITSVKHFFSGTMLSRLTGVIRDVSMAYAFGAHSSVAAFFVAYRLAHLFRRIFGEGAMQAALIPKFEELRNDTPKRACRFFFDLYVILSLFLIGLILCSMTLINLYLSYGSPSEGNTEIGKLTVFMMPGLLFICLYGLNSAILQCEKNYFIPSAAPVFFNLTWILGAILIAAFHPSDPMVWLAGTIILACIAQWLITLPQTLKLLKINNLEQPWRKIFPLSSDLRSMGKPFLLGVVGIAAAQINSAMDAIFARYADSEGPAYLWYAIRMQQLPIGLFAIAFSGALLPPLSRAIKANDIDKFKNLLYFSMKKCLWIMIPCSLLIFLFGKLAIKIVYERGAFDQHAVSGTAQCLYAYTLGIIPMALVIVLAPAFYSRGRYGITTAASVSSMALNLGLNALFVLGLGLGAVSVALATSASAWFNFVILAISIKGTKGKGTQATQTTQGTQTT